MNKKIKVALSKYGVFQWQLADAMCVSESTLTRKLRHELPEAEQNRICDLIRQAAARKEEGNE